MASPQEEMIARVAEAALGPDPAAAQQPAPAQPAPQQPQTDTSGPAPETTMGNAEAQGSPETEGDKMAQDAILHEVVMKDGSTKKMTPAQIEGLLGRYSDLNFRHQQMAPIHKLVDHFMKANPNENPQTLANKFLDMMRGQQSNPQMGADAERAQAQKAATAPADKTALQQWVEDNAISGLPPGYEDMFTQVGQQQKKMEAMMTAMQRLLGQAQGMTQASAMAQRGQQTNQQDVMSQTIANNLDRVQAALQLPDEAANDFMMFATERGYDYADFLDVGLLQKVMSDFKNAAAGPEMERIREIAQRRQSFTSAGVGGTPSQGGSPAQAAPETPLDRLTQATLAKRNI
jgi:hypothetical protein